MGRLAAGTIQSPAQQFNVVTGSHAAVNIAAFVNGLKNNANLNQTYNNTTGDPLRSGQPKPGEATPAFETQLRAHASPEP